MTLECQRLQHRAQVKLDVKLDVKVIPEQVVTPTLHIQQNSLINPGQQGLSGSLVIPHTYTYSQNLFFFAHYRSFFPSAITTQLQSQKHDNCLCLASIQERERRDKETERQRQRQRETEIETEAVTDTEKGRQEEREGERGREKEKAGEARMSGKGGERERVKNNILSS